MTARTAMRAPPESEVGGPVGSAVGANGRRPEHRSNGLAYRTVCAPSPGRSEPLHHVGALFAGEQRRRDSVTLRKAREHRCWKLGPTSIGAESSFNSPRVSGGCRSVRRSGQVGDCSSALGADIRQSKRAGKLRRVSGSQSRAAQRSGSGSCSSTLDRLERFFARGGVAHLPQPIFFEVPQPSSPAAHGAPSPKLSQSPPGSARGAGDEITASLASG